MSQLQVPSRAAHESTQVAVYKGHGGSILDVAAAPSGERFVSASQDKNLRVWPTGQAFAVFLHTRQHYLEKVCRC